MARRLKQNEEPIFQGCTSTGLVTNTAVLCVAGRDYPSGPTNIIVRSGQAGVGTSTWTITVQKKNSAGTVVAYTGASTALDLDTPINSPQNLLIISTAALSEGDSLEAVLTKDGGTATTAGTFSITVTAIP